MEAMIWTDSRVMLVASSDGGIKDSVGCCWHESPLPSSRGSKSVMSTVPSCIGKIYMHAMMLPPPIIIMFKQS
jgi:hypothetical protein